MTTQFKALKHLLLGRDPAFWTELTVQTQIATEFEQIVLLSALRKKAHAYGFARPETSTPLKLAIIGGYSLYPLHDILTHLLETTGFTCQLFLGDYDNYVAEITETDGALYQFSPQVVFLLPSAQRCKYFGPLTDSREAVQAEANAVVHQLLNSCRLLHERTGADVLLSNFIPSARHDLGAFRSRTLGSDWSFRKWVNLELGLQAPSFVRLCDMEFLAARSGVLAAEDARGWFESKQLCAPPLLVEICREAARLIRGLRTAPKKVLVLDLDNTLWGGVVAEDGLNGIEIGDTSPRGEAFKAFQRYIRTLKERGVLLAVCSKNDRNVAMEPFEKHPEMVLRYDDFVAFKADWNPKSDNIRLMATELKLGLDSFVFVDDNPAEIEILRQFAPEVTTILLGPDPADYATQLQDCRLFEAHNITAEDAQRTTQYRAENQRQELLSSVADMDAYLQSLEMVALIREFTPVDVPRLTQLINKSNQFNLTTRRRTEAEVQGLIGRPDYVSFSVRLQDRFGDHGLISIVIGHVLGEFLEIDTWLMSCRVLKRQVEETVLNELARLAQAKGCSRLKGIYVPTAKNAMVSDFYSRMGFSPDAISAERGEYTLDLNSYQPIATRIAMQNQLSHEPS